LIRSAQELDAERLATKPVLFLQVRFLGPALSAHSQPVLGTQISD
jgi:hypothetical protein